MATQIANVDEARRAVESFNNQLATRADQFKMVLPQHITPAQFQRTIITAVQGDVELLKADRQSLLLACMKAAQDGLLPDKREAALVIFSTRVKDGNNWVSVKQVQYMPMVYGLRKKILQSGEISSIETNVVYRAEMESGRFIYEAGTEAVLRHRPMLELTEEQTADSEIVAAYSVAVMKDGTRSFEVMRRSEINKVRQRSQTGAEGRVYEFGANKGKLIEPKGPWVEWFSEMARKTVMRRHSKTLPMSGDLIDVEARDEEIAARSVSAALAEEPGAPRLVPPSREEVGAGDPPHDPATGEISEEVQRTLDQEAFRQADGNGALAEESPAAPEASSESDGGGSLAESVAAQMIERCRNAQIVGDVLAVESDLKTHREGLGDDLAKTVDDAIAEHKARLKTPPGKAAAN
jgi:recombination protein RecT